MEPRAMRNSRSRRPMPNRMPRASLPAMVTVCAVVRML
jgi:hypothetical protein